MSASQQNFTISSAVTKRRGFTMIFYPERRLKRGMYKGETLIDIRFAPSEVGLYTCTTEFGSQLNIG